LEGLGSIQKSLQEKCGKIEKRKEEAKIHTPHFFMKTCKTLVDIISRGVDSKTLIRG